MKIANSEPDHRQGLFPDCKPIKKHVALDIEAFKALPPLKPNLGDLVQTVGNPMIQDEMSVGFDSRTFEQLAYLFIADYIQTQAEDNKNGASDWLDYKCYRSWTPFITYIMPLQDTHPLGLASQPQKEEKASSQQQGQPKEEEDQQQHDEPPANDDDDDFIAGPLPIRGRSIIGLDGQLAQDITNWCRVCMHDYYYHHCYDHRPPAHRKVFRRSLSISYDTLFIEHLTDAGSGGHTIALAMEVRPDERWIRLFLFDNHMQEYLYSVHDQIFQCMTDAILHNEYRLMCGIHASDVRCELVPLQQGHLHYDSQFMECMSLSFKVCMYLSFVRDCFDIRESKRIFQRDSRVFKSWIFTMINWLSHQKRIQDASLTVLQAPRMAYPLCEVSRKTCFLMLVPGAVTDALKDNCPRIYMWDLKEQAVSTLHFAGLTREPPIESQVFVERPRRK